MAAGSAVRTARVRRLRVEAGPVVQPSRPAPARPRCDGGGCAWGAFADVASLETFAVVHCVAAWHGAGPPARRDQKCPASPLRVGCLWGDVCVRECVQAWWWASRTCGAAASWARRGTAPASGGARRPRSGTWRRRRRRWWAGASPRTRGWCCGAGRRVRVGASGWRVDFPSSRSAPDGWDWEAFVGERRFGGSAPPKRRRGRSLRRAPCPTGRERKKGNAGRRGWGRLGRGPRVPHIASQAGWRRRRRWRAARGWRAARCWTCRSCTCWTPCAIPRCRSPSRRGPSGETPWRTRCGASVEICICLGVSVCAELRICQRSHLRCLASRCERVHLAAAATERYTLAARARRRRTVSSRRTARTTRCRQPWSRPAGRRGQPQQISATAGGGRGRTCW